MTPEDKFKIYRRLLASAADEEVSWWYMGTTCVVLEDGTSVPVSHPETVMIYSLQTVADVEFRIHWREVGYFRDPVTGDIASSWLNPITGATVSCPSSFEEGPATYTVCRTDSGLDITLEQNHAIVRSITMDMVYTDNQIIVTQTERKVRSFPDQDGIIQEPDEDGGAEAQTTLMFSAKADDFNSDQKTCINASGTYEFRLQTIPKWMGFKSKAGHTIVNGVIAKGRPDEKINAVAWDRLNQLYPKFFPTASHTLFQCVPRDAHRVSCRYI